MSQEQLPDVPDLVLVPEPLADGIDPYLRLMRESQVRQLELEKLQAEVKALKEKNVPVIRSLQEDVIRYAELATTRLQDARRERGRVVVLARLLTRMIYLGTNLLDTGTLSTHYDAWEEVVKEAREVLQAAALEQM